MSLTKYIERLSRMDTLISMMATGSPDEFAGKLGLGRSAFFESLQEMRGMGVDIRYSHNRQSYYYADNRRIKIRLEKCFSEDAVAERIPAGGK
jgi:hypothetical protein